MKFFIAFALLAVASAYIIPVPVTNTDAELEAILEAIHSPSTDPATAAALIEMVNDLLGISPAPIHVGPAIVDVPAEYEPISVGPAIIDFPLPDGGAVTAPVKPTPSPVVVGPVVPEGSSPLVQLIININAPNSAPVPGAVVGPSEIIADPVIIVDEADNDIIPSPVIIVDEAENVIVPEPVIIVDPTVVVPEPVIVVDPVVPAPVIVSPVEIVPVAPVIVDTPVVPAPVIVSPIEIVPVSPVIVDTPIVPSPAVTLPETLN